MQVSLMYMIKQLPGAQADKALVDIAAAAMAEKLADKRGQGRGGWHSDTCDVADLQKLLVRNLADGDMVDVMNLAAMVHVRHELYGEKIMLADLDAPLPPPKSGFTLYDASGRPTSFAGETAATYDHRTGLLWGPTLPEAMNHGDALWACSDFKLFGLSDWRMPHRSELYTIVSDTEVKPAVPKGFFQDTKSEGYWTCDPVPGFPGCFRVVYFGYGNVGYLHGDDFRFFARPVRVGGLPAGQ